MISGINLYNISEEYRYLLQEIADENGVINEHIEKRLDELEKPIQEKSINYIRCMKNLEAELKAIELERKAMQARERSLTSKIEWFKKSVLSAMEASEISEISCPQFVIKLRKNPEKVCIYDVESIPDDYITYNPVYDLMDIKNDIKEGKIVPGARLIQENRIEIK